MAIQVDQLTVDLAQSFAEVYNVCREMGMKHGESPIDYLRSLRNAYQEAVNSKAAEVLALTLELDRLAAEQQPKPAEQPATEPSAVEENHSAPPPTEDEGVPF